MWKSTYRYSQELEMMEFGAPLETPSSSWFSAKTDPDFSELDLGEDVAQPTRELDPFAEEFEDFELDGETFVQDAFEIGGRTRGYHLCDRGPSRPRGRGSRGKRRSRRGEPRSHRRGCRDRRATHREFLCGQVSVEKVQRSKLPEFAATTFCGEQKGTDIAYVHYRDMTGFPRWATVYVDDPSLQLLKPLTKSGYPRMSPKMILKGKLIDVPFYRELPIGTRVKLTTPYLTQFKGKTGTIRRGMIMNSENKDGTWDKYRIQLDDVIDWYYESVTNFQVYDNKYTPKHYAKSTTLKWGPWFQAKPKVLYKQKIQRQTFARQHRAKKVEIEKNYDYVHKYFDQTREFTCHLPDEHRRLPEEDEAQKKTKKTEESEEDENEKG